MSRITRLQIVDRLIPMLGNLSHGIAVGSQVRRLFACVDHLRKISHWTLGHALASNKLRALAAGFAVEHSSFNNLDLDALEQMRGAFHELRTYVEADTSEL